nr:hypothetical protein [Paraburkholderia sp.]
MRAQRFNEHFDGGRHQDIVVIQPFDVLAGRLLQQRLRVARALLKAVMKILDTRIGKTPDK